MKNKPVRYPVTSQDLYGVPEMSMQEEQALSDNERRTIRNKISMIDKANLLQQALDQVKFRAKGIPVLNDASHAEGVQDMTDLVIQAADLLWKAAMYGIE